MYLLLAYTFLAGILTVLSPCIWPILPILFFNSKGKRVKAFALTTGIVLSFTFLTLLITYVIRFLPFGTATIRILSASLLFIIGFSLVVPAISLKLETFLSRLLSGNVAQSTASKESFWSSFITGLSLGGLWAPCAGPILATITALTAAQDTSKEVMLLIGFYVLGMSLALFLIALLGGKVFSRLSLISRNLSVIQSMFGLFMMVLSWLMLTGYDTVLQSKILNTVPAISNSITNLESNDIVYKELERIQYGNNPDVTTNMPNQKVAPEIIGIDNWINTDKPLTLKDLRGKVVLVDFWTYTCINCVRTFPYVTGWYEKYKDDGFVVLGVHTPEFEFEKETSNVLSAVERFGITYPVAQDNDYKTWRNYKNRYWPAHYLIDANGVIRYTHFGEGNYEETEKMIQELLLEKGTEVDKETLNLNDATPAFGQTPETYLGLNRLERFASNERPRSGTYKYSFPKSLPKDAFAYSGSWRFFGENSMTIRDSKLLLNFTAKDVFLVITPLESSPNPQKIEIYLDGKPIPVQHSGADVMNSVVTLDESRLYSLVKLDSVDSHSLLINFLSPGIKLFAFTFGS